MLPDSSSTASASPNTGVMRSIGRDRQPVASTAMNVGTSTMVTCMAPRRIIAV